MRSLGSPSLAATCSPSSFSRFGPRTPLTSSGRPLRGGLSNFGGIIRDMVHFICCLRFSVFGPSFSPVFLSARFGFKLFWGILPAANPNLRHCWGVETPKRSERRSSVLVGSLVVGTDRVEKGNLGEPEQPWRSHRLRHPEPIGACLNGTYGFCCCPAQVQCTAFMEGGALGKVLCPFILESQTCVWFFFLP